jgi:MoaA/NifB/PqqE/SkfB family radical SAM enzyme
MSKKTYFVETTFVVVGVYEVPAENLQQAEAIVKACASLQVQPAFDEWSVRHAKQYAYFKDNKHPDPEKLEKDIDWNFPFQAELKGIKAHTKKPNK